MKHPLTLAAAALLTLSSNTQATTLGFDCITGNNAGDCGIGVSQLTVDVTSYGIGTGSGGVDQVLFTFMNTGSAQSTVSEIYFDDGSLLGLAGLIDKDDGTGGDPNVDFSQGATPPDLPGGNSITPSFQVTNGLLASADNPAPKWGISPGQSLGIIFDLQSTLTFDDVLAELGSGELRIGLHVTNFASGGSESFVNSSVVPVPAAAWLFGSGLLALTGVARRKRAASE